MLAVILPHSLTIMTGLTPQIALNRGLKNEGVETETRLLHACCIFVSKGDVVTLPK